MMVTKTNDAASNTMQKLQTQFDAIIVGAGLSGLAAAHELKSAGKSVLVLEAAARAGGRVWTTDFGATDTKVDWGAEWIIPTMHHEVMRILNRASIVLQEEELTSSIKWQTASGRLHASYDMLKTQNAAFAKALNDIESDAAAFLKQQDVGYDPEQSLRLYLTKRIQNADAVELMEAAIFPLTGAAPEDVSTRMLWLEIGYHGGSIDDTLNANACRIPQGCGVLAQQLLPWVESQVAFNSPVTRIIQHEKHVDVETIQNTFTASQCIVAVPLSTLHAIEFQPALPTDMTLTAQHSNAGRVAKAWAIVSSAQPPAEVFNTQSPLRYGYARELSEQQWLACGQILKDSDQPLTVAQCHDLFKEQWPDAEIQVLDIVDWPNETWAQASWYSSRCGWSGKTAQFNAPLGNLHFAGGDIAQNWAGWMEGALLSGRDAAKTVLTAAGA